ncbi:MAG: glycosyltransferase family protein, partial [Nitriliruptorales bacterium]
RYDYGAEDVDLCWRLRRAGGRLAVAPGAVLFHHEGATRHRVSDAATRNRRQERNWDLLAQRFGPEVAREVDLDRLRSEHALSPRRFEVAITVTRDLEEAGYGDWYTAHELGDALGALGWTVRHVERYRDAWYDLPATVDAVVVLLDTFDVRRVARPGLTTIAWIRNRTDRWIATPWFDDFDLVLAVSTPSAATVAEQTRHRAELFPIATNPARFSGEPGGDLRERIVFTGNYWGRDTRVDELVAVVPDLEVHGQGWDEVPAVASRWMGRRTYGELPDLYREALVVVDQAADHTRADASVNSRVFDALAAGALVVTNQVAGSQELFDDRLPTYETPQELAGLVSQVRENPNAALRRVNELQELVRERHTYAARAARLQELLVERARRARFVLKTSTPSRSRAERWGDWHLAEALARELRAAGHPTAIQTADEWEERAGHAADVAVHLKGRSVAPRAEGQVHVVWNISHPEELTVEECDAADLVLVASRTFPDELRTRTATPVGVLLQATDERRFRPLPADPEGTHDVAFVGNSRHAERRIVRDAVLAGLRPAVYGGNWERFLPDPDLVVATFVPNEDLPAVYSSVKVLLNDHWEGMRTHGFVSNRVFDALACGACIVSDEHEELTALFGEAVATYVAPADLRTTVEALLADPERRAEMGATGRARVLGSHSFRHRAAELLDHLRPLLPADRLP